MERNFLTIFLRPQDTLEALGGGQRSQWPQAHRARPRALPPTLWAPHSPSHPNSSSINTLIFHVDQRAHQKYFSAAASFCSHKIPSGALFWYSNGWGFHNGGLLHQPWCPSNVVWVVYHRPTSPTTRENPSSSTRNSASSSAGGYATTTALQLTCSSSARWRALLLSLPSNRECWPSSTSRQL